jgi:hypothetical protein
MKDANRATGHASPIMVADSISIQELAVCRMVLVR